MNAKKTLLASSLLLFLTGNVMANCRIELPTDPDSRVPRAHLVMLIKAQTPGHKFGDAVFYFRDRAPITLNAFEAVPDPAHGMTGEQIKEWLLKRDLKKQVRLHFTREDCR